jgi:hypothetical protein
MNFLERMSEAVNQLALNNIRRKTQYIEDGGEETHYLDGKEMAYEDIIRLISDKTIDTYNGKEWTTISLRKDI